MLRRLLSIVALSGLLAGSAAAQLRYPPYGRARVRYPKPPRDKTGKVKLETKAKDASVYVDGAYAGIAKKLRSFPLKPGKHDIELRDNAGHTYSERVHVIRGKTVTIRAELPA